MAMRVYEDLLQGSDEWLQARCGLLTASEIKLIMTPTLKPASNDKERAHLYELLAQRVTGYVEPGYQGANMVRGHEDEVYARIEYHEHFAPVAECGFVTNDKWGFTLGYSPDGVVGDVGLIECKSRMQKYQVRTILDGEVPDEYILQIQTGMLVAEREWCDFISYCGGMPMVTIRVYPDERIQSAIIDAASAFEDRLSVKIAMYHKELKAERPLPFIQTERRIIEDIRL